MNINQSEEFRQLVVRSGRTLLSLACKAVLVFGIVGGSPVLHTASQHLCHHAAASESERRRVMGFDGGAAEAGAASFAAMPSLDGERHKSNFSPMFVKNTSCNYGNSLTSSSARGFGVSLLPVGGVDDALGGSRAARLLGGLVTCSHRLPMSLDETSYATSGM